MDFTGRAGRAELESREQDKAARNRAASVLSLQQLADTVLTAVGKDAVAYLQKRGVPPVPIGRALKPLPWSKRQRFQELGREWAIAPENSLYLSAAGVWNVRSHFSLRIYKRLEDPGPESIGNFPGSGKALNGVLFRDEISRLSAKMPSSGWDPPTLFFYEDQRLTIQEFHSSTEELFADRIARLAGQLASQHSS